MSRFQGYPKPGDLIEIFRSGYQHWAVYVGDGYVVHMAAPSEYAGAGSSSIMSVFTNRAYVKKELLRDVAGGDRVKVNKKYDLQHTPLPRGKIVRRAEARIGLVLPYDLHSYNCEHFVTEIRYGVKLCEQVENAETYIALGAFAAVVLGGVAFAMSRNKRQNQ